MIGALAIALGLKQSAWEAGQGTYYFLLHRPASRKFIFGTKLATGAAIVLVIGGLLMLFYAMWAATPGNSATPFFWSMTLAAWQLLAVHVAGVFGGVFERHSPGTLVRHAACAAGGRGDVRGSYFFIPWWWAWVPLLAICAGVVLVSIFYYARQRDY